MNTRPMCLPLLLALAGALIGAPAGAQVPYGYELIEITDDCCSSNPPALNNQGQIAFMRRWADNTHADIFLWENGSILRITDDVVEDTDPSINANGDVIWRRTTGPGSATDVFLYRDGEILQITDTSDYEQAAAIGNGGEVLYTWALSSSDDRLMMWDNGLVTQISPPGLSNQSGQINDLGDVAWTRYDFGVFPWESEIILLDQEQALVVSGDELQPQQPALNDLRQVAWADGEQLYLWEDGQTTFLAPDARAPDLNDRGYLVFTQEREALEGAALVLYDGTSFRDLAITERNDLPDINDYGDVAWRRTILPPPNETQILFLRRLRVAGDFDEDEDSDLADSAVMQRCYGASGEELVLDCVLPNIDRDDDVDADDLALLFGAMTGPVAPGDVDGDGDVDLQDFAELQTCFDSAGAVTGEACMRADINDDWTVDLDDAAALFLAMTDTLG